VLCANLVKDDLITQRLGHEVEALAKIETGWRVSGKDLQGSPWEAEADVVLVCCAHSAKKFSFFANFPLTPVRGQITTFPQTAYSKALKAIVCGDGYCAAALDGVHVVGATHTFDVESNEVRASDHAENLAKLAEYAPALHQAIIESLTLYGGGDKELSQLTGRASIRCSAPGSMPLVGVVKDGLYCSLAHGTRGLLTAGLAAEVLAAQICGQLPPLPSSIIEALAPLPRVRNKG
jgi:tRNA 5-methylaminomethyl-2-thiouridine biosynthesis bifunctional protein